MVPGQGPSLAGRLSVCFRDKLGGTHVRDPDLHGPEPLGAQPPPMLAYSIPGVRHQQMSHVTKRSGEH